MPRQKSFKNLTQRERFMMYFHTLGYRPVQSRTGKYAVLFNGTHYVFLGQSGAVRVNSRNSATGSQSYTDQFKRVMENWAAQKGYSL